MLDIIRMYVPIAMNKILTEVEIEIEYMLWLRLQIIIAMTMGGIMRKLHFSNLSLVFCIFTLYIGTCLNNAIAEIIHVPKDYPTIQQGIDTAINGDTVLVADGTYKGIGNRDIDFKGKDIIVVSENGAESTIIDCENEGRGFYFYSGETKKAILSGFTITNGTSVDTYRGAICCMNSSPTIENNVIVENNGGGIYCHSSSVVIRNNKINANNSKRDGGGICCINSFPDILNNDISKNSSSGEGSGIYLQGTEAVIVDNTINYNKTLIRGGGVSIDGISTVVGNIIYGNSAQGEGGGVLLHSATPYFANNLISNNTAGSGAGIYCSWIAKPKIVNCTISANSASYIGGGIVCSQYSAPTLINSIIWSNKPDGINIGTTAIIDVIYSDIQEGCPGEGNINADPLFVDAKNGDYHLQDNSPCISSGIMTDDVPVTDIDGNPRSNPSGSRPDMGCYENSYFPPIMSITSAEVLPNTQTKIQLSVTDAKGIASGDITISYDSNILSIIDIKPTDLTSNMNLTPNTEIQGQVKITMAGTTGIQSGSGSLIDITVSVNANAKMGSETKLHIINAEVYDESGKSIPIKLEDGLVRIKQACIKGDVNNDGEIKSNDAMLILRIAVGLLEPNDYQRCAADYNGDGKIASNDATLVLRKAAGLEAPSKNIITDRHISLSLSEAHGLKGDTISVPITVDNIDILSSGDMSISYDSNVLRAIDVLSSGGLLMVNNITQPGLIRISFANADILNNGKLAEIKFEVLTNDVSPLTFKMVELYNHDALPLNTKFTNKQFGAWTIAPDYSALLQNYPNPFNPETWIPYQLHESGEVAIKIHNVTGELVRELKLGYKPAGQYITKDMSAYWDGKNEAGESVASGIYFYTIQAGEYSATRKMIIMQ